MRSQWGSKLGFILATAGSAIGLGNIWRFPYLIAQNGGGAFLLVYLFCVSFLGYFLLTAKVTFGQIAQTDFIDAFQKVGKKGTSKLWAKFGGFSALFNIFFVSSVYIIVISWTLSYVLVGIRNFLGIYPLEINSALFEHLTSSYSLQLFWIILCLLISGYILAKGVKEGIEKISLYLMPILLCILIFMVVWISFEPNTGKGFAYLFYPDWKFLGFTDNGFEWQPFAHLSLLALGQAIYSLSLGLGVCFIYGSYLKADIDIKKSTLWVVFLDTCVAILASMIVLPAVFAFDLESNQGPALSFVTLPFVFNQMYGGNLLMLTFFILLFFGALTSIISIYEPAISLLIEKLGLIRKKATLIVLGTNLALALVILASFTGIFNLTIGGKNLFDAVDYLTGTYTMGLMMLIYCLFMGWKIFPKIADELGLKSKIYKSYFKFVLRWLAPFVLILLFITA